MAAESSITLYISGRSGFHTGKGRGVCTGIASTATVHITKVQHKCRLNVLLLNLMIKICPEFH